MSIKRTLSLFPALMVVAFALSASAAAQEREAEVALQQAMHAEQVEGDLERAIELYRGIVDQHAGERPVAAKALLKLGQCYEKLGRTEAMNAYQQLVREYGDQSTEAEAARARLAALSQQAVAAAPSGPVARLILSDEETNVNNFYDMRVSPDGRYVAYTAMGNDGALFIRDLESGVTTKLAEGWNDRPIWSSDGRRIAYVYRGPWAVEASRLKVVDVATGTSSTIRGVEGVILWTRAWSPDGIWLACQFSTANERRGSLLLNLESGDTVMLARRSNNAAASFSPDGQYVAYTVFEDSSRHDIEVMRMADGARHRITEGPDNDRDLVWSPDGDVLMYSNEAGTMVIPMAEGRAAGPVRLLRANGLGDPAGWTASGDFYYVEYNTTRKAYRIPVDSQTRRATGRPQLMSPAPDRGVVRFAWSPDMRYVAFAPRGGIIQILATETGTLSAFRVGSEADASNLWWSGDSKEALFVAHRRSREAPGGTVRGLNPVTGVVRDLLPRAEDVARIHLSPDGSKKVLYSGDWGGGRRKLILADAMAAEGVVLADESQFDGNLANWARPAFSPDGASVLFGTVKYGEDIIDASHLWIAEVDGGEPRKLVSEPWIRYAVWHPSSNYVVYTVRQRDRTHDVYVIDVRTGNREEISLPEDFNVDIHQWSPDGRWLGATRDAGHVELWVVQNVLAEGSGSR